MYSRRIKMNKKKPKPSRQKQTPGSNWGPRLALIERERAIAAGAIFDDDEDDAYDIQHELVNNIKRPPPGGGMPNAALTGRLSQHQSLYGNTRHASEASTSVDPVLRLGRSSSPNYFYYNYSRRTAPNAASSQRKISCPEPSSSVHSQQQRQRERLANGNKSIHQQHHRRASYVLGSSSGYCSGSVTTLSTCANTSNETGASNTNLTKPLTLIIPPHDGHHGLPRDFDGRSHNRAGGGILLKRGTKLNHPTSHSHRHQNGNDEDFGTEEQSLSNSFPSSSAYQSSGEEEQESHGNGSTLVHITHESGKRLFHNPMAHMNAKKTTGANGGILQVSTRQEIVQVHAMPKVSPTLDDMGTATEPETLELGAGLEEDTPGRKGVHVGSTITALHKGVTMVYVPMKDKERNTNEKPTEITENIPDLGHQNLSDQESTSTSSSYREAETANKEPEDSLMSSNFILKKKQDEPGMKVGACGGGVVMDSLLDSFDSIMFKPKPGEALKITQEKCHGHSQQQNGPSQGEAQHKGIRKRPEQPPPLPPPGTEQSNGQQQQKQKSLRFALENLETVLNPSSLKTPSPTSSGEESTGDQDGHQRHVPLPPKKVLKKVTLSLPGVDAISSRNHELLLNYEELNTCSSEILLDCGHVRNDDYSTLSSMTSSAQEISDLEEVINGCSGSGHDDGTGHQQLPSNNSTSGGSGGESDVGGMGDHNESTPPQREPRSVLQQLRDLSRLIRGSSPTKKESVQTKKETVQRENNNNSFYLHSTGTNNNNSGGNNNVDGDTEVAKRKTSDATDNSADSGKGSGSGTSASGSSGQEGSSASSAEPSPNNARGGAKSAVSVSKVKNATGLMTSSQKAVQQGNGRRIKVATIRGRGGGTGSRHYCSTNEENPVDCQPQLTGGDDSCSQRSSICSCQECCGYRSDCNECVLYNKPPNSKELCSNETRDHPVRIKVKQQAHPTINLPPPPPPPSQQRAPKQSVSKLLVRRTSSRIRAAAARRTASLRRAAQARQRERKPVILDYCDCSNCDMQGCMEGDHFEECDNEEYDEGEYEDEMEGCSDQNCKPPCSSQRYQPPRDSHSIPLGHQQSSKKAGGGSANSKCKSRVPDSRKISTSSGVSSSSSSTGKTSRIAALRSSSLSNQQQIHGGSQLLRQSDAAAAGAALANHPVVSLGMVPSTSTGNLFTIDEANEDSVYGESAAGAGNGPGGAVVIGKGRKVAGGSSVSSSSGSNKSGPRVDFQLHTDDPRITSMNGSNNRRMSSNSQHSHPKCWLAPDATLGWSDLESLYSQNMKLDSESARNKRGSSSSKKSYPLPAALRDECPTCWKELSEMKKNCPDPNRTVDRTKRMFIWLNRRHKEFHAPWWEAKKQASMRWLITKAFAHSVPKDKIPDPFKESKKGKPTKYSLRDEIVKGLVSGRLYCMALDSLYRSQQNNYHLSQNLTHWEIIKILSRRGIYIAQPSDMKLTETTLRQKKPIRTAAHIALIEAMMGLYAKEILGRDRIAATLRSFGRSIDPDTNSPERLVISWINTAVTTLKSYILSNAPQHLPPNKVNRWLNLPEVSEIRDLCDGVGVCALFALYCSNDLKIEEISVPEPGDTLTIYDSITNHSLVQKLCEDLFPEPIYHLCVTDFLYIHGCMKQNILCFLVDLFVHLEINPTLRVNRLTHVPIRVDL